MEDWKNLMDIGRQKSGEDEGEVVERSAYELARSEPAKARVEFETFSPPPGLSEKEKGEVKENLKEKIKKESTINVGACQPESDGDIVCRFKTTESRSVLYGEEGTVPVNVEATIHLDDFDEVRAHMLNKVFKGKNSTVFS